MDTQLDRQEDALEYNDGLGDLLREKERLEFSWTKTTVSLITIVGVVLLGVILMFSIGRSAVSKKIVKYDPSLTLEVPVSHIEKEALDENPTSKKKNPVKEVVVSSKKTHALSISDKIAALISSSSESSSSTKATSPTPRPLNSKQKSLQKLSQKNPHPYKVIVGTFSQKANGIAMQTQLKKIGYDSFIWKSRLSNGSVLYKVQTGAFETKKLATEQQKNLKSKSIDSYLMKK